MRVGRFRFQVCTSANYIEGLIQTIVLYKRGRPRVSCYCGEGTPNPRTGVRGLCVWSVWVGVLVEPYKVVQVSGFIKVEGSGGWKLNRGLRPETLFWIDFLFQVMCPLSHGVHFMSWVRRG